MVCIGILFFFDFLFFISLIVIVFFYGIECVLNISKKKLIKRMEIICKE